MVIKQRTLKNAICAEGIGVHTGEVAKIKLCPAPPNTGIVFKRVDLSKPVLIPARIAYIVNTKNATCLGKKGVQVMTVEHLLSAFAGLWIDNAIVEIDGLEVPIMDGSANAFVFLLQSAGFVEQAAPKLFLKVKQPMSVQKGEKSVHIAPATGLAISLKLAFSHPAFGAHNSVAVFNFSTTGFIKEISRARTFAFLSDVQMLKKNKLALGGSLGNTVVFDEHGVMNKAGLRFPDECVRHKILDVMGDLYLLGPVLGRFSGYCSGHSLNHLLSARLLQNKRAWEYVQLGVDPVELRV